MATKSENAEIAVLQDQMGTVQKSIEKLDTTVATGINTITTSINNIQLTYVTKAEFDEYKKNASKSRLLNTLTTVLVTAVLTGLVLYFIYHGRPSQ